MYKTIQPYYKVISNDSPLKHKTLKELYVPGKPAFLNLDCIESIYHHLSDETLTLNSITLSGRPDHDQVIIVSAEEAEEIKKMLVKSSSDALNKSIDNLTHAVRTLWELLRARLH